jgi:uncharacterized protein (TIGR02453 family)
MAFSGFSRDAMQFLVDLASNNERSWFQPRKAEYERLLKVPLEELVVALADRFEARGIPLVADPARSPFRIYRDTRFSKDKTPYKTQAAVQFLRAAADRDVHQPGFYVHLEPGECFAAAGVWMPDAATLLRIRKAIVAKPAAWAPIGKLELWGESYARPPKDVDPGHRFVEALMRKHYLTWVDFKDREVVGPKFIDRVAKACQRMAPLVKFLDRALGLG